jgi:hypothetical protein
MHGPPRALFWGEAATRGGNRDENEDRTRHGYGACAGC